VACYHPIPAAQGNPGDGVRLNPPLGEAHLALPCGKCIGCKTSRATHWAHRCSHESKSWDHNTFITLTYADEHLPYGGYLDPVALQLFYKRLRRAAGRNQRSITSDHSSSIRYFSCGEYGEKEGRPHYHAILFNAGFSDRYRTGKDKYSSDTLSKLWPFGDASLGDATPAAANYIAQYQLKKQTGRGRHTIDADGVIRPEPFLRMSLKPAIGYTWLERFKTDLTHGYLVEDGTKTAIPRTYLTRLKTTDPELHAEITFKKGQHTIDYPTDNSDPQRLKAAEKIHLQKKQQQDNRTL
jgi:hypothetical protein